MMETRIRAALLWETLKLQSQTLMQEPEAMACMMSEKARSAADRMLILPSAVAS